MSQPLCVLALCLFVVSPVSGHLVQVVLGDSVKFPPLPGCSTGEQSALLHRLRDDSSRLVASSSLDQDWKPGPDYSDSLNQSGSVVLNAANMNDNGLYELTCNDRVLKNLQLDVLVPTVVHVSSGVTVRLPCYTVTAGESVQSVRWERDGEPVLVQVPEENNRVSLSPDWHRVGDLSLTINQVQPGDRGDYFCYFYSNGRKSRGDPAAVRLEVLEVLETRIPGPAACTPEPSSEQLSHCSSWMLVTGLLMVLLLSVLIAGAVRNKKCKHRICGRGKETREEEIITCLQKVTSS